MLKSKVLVALLMLVMLCLVLTGCNTNTNLVENEISNVSETNTATVVESTDSKDDIVGVWYPSTALRLNDEEVDLKEVYGDSFTSEDCITLNEDKTYTITKGLFNVEEDGLKGTYSVSNGTLILKAEDESESGYIYLNGILSEERDDTTVIFEKK